MSITKEELAEVVADNLQDFAVTKITNAVFPIIESLQKENAELKKENEILNLKFRKKQLGFDFLRDELSLEQYQDQYKELEARLKELKGE